MTLHSNTAWRHCVYFTGKMCTLYYNIACVHCIVTLYACIVTLCMLYNFSEISDTALILHSDTVYGEHSVTLQFGTVSVLYIYNCTVMTVCITTLCTLYNDLWVGLTFIEHYCMCIVYN